MKQETQRMLAAKAGQTTYTTGKPCKHGHMSPRPTKTGACVECSKLNTKARNELISSVLRAALERGPSEVETVTPVPPKKKDFKSLR